MRSYFGYRQLGGRWPLVLVGDGPERDQLEQIALKSCYADDIRFEGLRNSSDLTQYYAFAGCFVLPSTREPWGLVVNEAMASSLPVLVSSRCGCAEDLVEHGENGFVFDTNNDEELTSGLLTVAEACSRTESGDGGALPRDRHWVLARKLGVGGSADCSRVICMPSLVELPLNTRPQMLRPSEPNGWTQVVSHLDPKYGGLSSAVPALSAAITEVSGVPSSIAAFCERDEQFAPAVPAQVRIDYWPLRRPGWQQNDGPTDRFRRLVEKSAGVHVHGLWQGSTWLAARTARELKKPYLISAHGMLERWALRHKRLKKSIYAALFERSNLRRAHCLHALTNAEAEDYRRFGLSNPIAVIPNGVAVPATLDADLFLNQYPALAQKRLVVFLGRLHNKKGIDLLCQAWAHCRAKCEDAHLVLAGPDSEGTQARLQTLCADLGVTESVTFTGMLHAAFKWSLLASAELFVLPSHSEGLSVSVLEALGAGCPVIITSSCNMPEVSSRNCGWIIGANVPDIEMSLTSFFTSSDSDRRRMAANGRRLVAERYSWQRVGNQMSSVHHWLEGGPIPSNVDLRVGDMS